MIRGRLRRPRGAGENEQADEFIEIDPSELSGLFAAPNWLRDAGFTAWFAVGVVVLVAGVVWLLTLTQVIVVPLIVAGVIAAVAGQLVELLERHRVPRSVSALLVLLLIVVLIVVAGVLAAYLVLRGIATEATAISDQLKHGAGKFEGWLTDLGISDGKAQAAITTSVPVPAIRSRR